MRDDGAIIEHSRVITYTRTVSYGYSDGRSVVNTSASQVAPAPVASKAESVVSKAPSIARSVSAPTAVPQTTTVSDNDGGAVTQLFGALLGAAAGAAVTYAFVRSERDSAKKESDFGAFMDAKNAVKTAAGFFAQPTSQPQQPHQDPQAAQAAPPNPPQSVHRDIDAQSCISRASQLPRSSAPRQIEAAPASYYSPSSYETPRTQVAEPRAIEYAPAYSVSPSRAPTRPAAAHRSLTSPEMLMIEKARSTVSTAKPYTTKPELLMIEKAGSTVSMARTESVASASTARPPKPSKPQSVVSEYKARSVAPSAAPSSFVSSFVPDFAEKKSSAGSQYSHHSSRSKAKSSHTSHTERGHRSRKEHDSSPSPLKEPSKAPIKAPSKAASVISSIFGRNKKDDDEDFIDDLDIEEETEDDFDLDTVVPDDSISQIGSHPRRKHRTHKSKKIDDDESSVSKSTHKSKKHDDAESSISKSSKHSHRSERSHRSHRSKVDSADDEDSSRPKRSSRKPSIVSEVSEASTARPVSSKSKSRKDSLTQGQSEYDHLFDDAVQYGAGNVAVRGITPSMVSASRRNPVRSMTTHNHAAKMRNFEGSQAGLKTYD
jgi:hypothetical protein